MIKLSDTTFDNSSNKQTGNAIEAISKGLAEEGMKDLRRYITTTEKTPNPKQKINRRKKFENLKIILPKVLVKQNGKYKQLDYEADLLAKVPYEKIQAGDIPINTRNSHPNTNTTAVDIGGSARLTSTRLLDSGPVSIDFFCRQLADIIPNPFQIARIVQDWLADNKLDMDKLAHKKFP